MSVQRRAYGARDRRRSSARVLPSSISSVVRIASVSRVYPDYRRHEEESRGEEQDRSREVVAARATATVDR